MYFLTTEEYNLTAEVTWDTPWPVPGHSKASPFRRIDFMHRRSQTTCHHVSFCQ